MNVSVIAPDSNDRDGRATSDSTIPDHIGGFVVGIHGSDEWAKLCKDLRN